MVVFAGKTWSAFVLLQRAESGCQRMITGELQWSLLSCRCGAAVAHDNAEESPVSSLATMFEPVVEVVMVSTVNFNVAGQLVGMVYMGGTSAGKLTTCNAVEEVLTPCMGLQLHVKIGEIEMHGSCLLLFKYPFTQKALSALPFDPEIREGPSLPAERFDHYGQGYSA
ncbi:hypothetical protein PI124_g5247 [Phytophthora idaei]|nr:hypothetical protein PI125_g5976 [Phytophthora idaei]KAG3250111.1 hypothetical protein PI124_g5247 [Phytophthora idaei]